MYDIVVHESTGLPIAKPGFSSTQMSIDSRGFRGPELAVPKPAGRRRIAFLGASTTFCMEVAGNAETWPHLVAERLGCEYVNASFPGYSVAQSLANLEHRVTPLAPDVIVIYHAVNDIALDTRAVAREQGLPFAPPGGKSRLARISHAWNLVERTLAVGRRMREAKESEGRLEFDADRLSRLFAARLEALVEAAEERASVVALVTFAVQPRRSMDGDALHRACANSLYYMPYLTADSLLDAFDAYNEAIRRVAAKTGAILVEAADTVPGDREHFVDTVHLTAAGCRRLADRVAAALE